MDFEKIECAVMQNKPIEAVTVGLAECLYGLLFRATYKAFAEHQIGKEQAAKEKQKWRSDCAKWEDLLALYAKIGAKMQKNVQKSEDLRRKIQKTEEKDEKLSLALRCIACLTDDESLVQ